MIYQIASRAFKRDKQNAYEEVKDFFVAKNQQEKTWYLVNAVLNAVRQKVFSSVEAQRTTEFLSKKFDVRLSAIEYAEAFSFPVVLVETETESEDPPSRSKKVFSIKAVKKSIVNSGIFQRIFTRLQTAVPEELLEYNGARSLISEIVRCHPEAKKCLQR